MDSNNSDSYVSHKVTIMPKYPVKGVPSERPSQVIPGTGWSVATWTLYGTADGGTAPGLQHKVRAVCRLLAQASADWLTAAPELVPDGALEASPPDGLTSLA